MHTLFSFYETYFRLSSKKAGKELTFSHFLLTIILSDLIIEHDKEEIIMGKIEVNKQEKASRLLKSAYQLFLKQGIEKTTVSDITHNAGVAKGTFYLYFQDKYQVRDCLIAHHAGVLFRSACEALMKEDLPEFEDQIIFLVNYTLEELGKHPELLNFISKNLSWGIFHKALLFAQLPQPEVDCLSLYDALIHSNPDIHLKDPDIMLFMIIELASSVSYSTILHNDPIPFEKLRPYLNMSIRSIIHNHLITD